MNWKTIRLELAGTPEFPAGSVSRGYLIRIPLDGEGAIDTASLTQSPSRATIRRFWSTDPDECGCVVCADGDCVLRCAGKADRLLANPAKPFEVGLQVAVMESDGASLPFRIASISSFG